MRRLKAPKERSVKMLVMNFRKYGWISSKESVILFHYITRGVIITSISIAI